MDQEIYHRLTIGRLDCTYLVPRDHPAPERVRSDLDEIARRYVRDSCEKVFSARVDERDPSVWLIDKVQMDVLMDLGAAPADEIGAFWASQIANSVIETIQRGEDGSHVMHFASRVEYLAWFLRELAAGRAWGRWCFEQFTSLRSLPTAPAIRETLLGEPERAEPVLLHLLRSHALTEVVGMLSKLDRERLLDVVAPPEEDLDETCLGAALDFWAEHESTGFSVLELYLRLRDAPAGYSPGQSRGATEALLILHQWTRAGRLDEILSAISAGRIAEILRGSTASETRVAFFLLSLISVESSWIARITTALGSPSIAVLRPASTTIRNPGETHFVSEFGGVFLLLPALLENRQLLAAFADPEEGLLRYRLFSACFGPLAKEASRDDALLLASGLDGGCSIEHTERPPFELDDPDLLPGDLEFIAAAELDPPLTKELSMSAAWLMRSLARRLPGLGKSSFDYLWRNILGGRSSVTRSPGRIVVEFAPRPLQIVLHMASYRDLKIVLPWIADSEILIRFMER